MSGLSGTKALSEIDKILKAARGHLGDIDARYGATRNQLAGLKSAQLGVYAELARLRLVDIEQGDVIDKLDRTDKKAADLLERREQAAARLNESIEKANAALAEVERRRDAQQESVSKASEALDAAEADAQAALTQDEAYQQQLQRTDQADFVADQADEKASAAEADRTEKGEPYENDALFAYLWARGYGTAEYRAFPLTRWLDGIVARTVNYEPARQNYALLTEIPVRLGEHAASMRALFDQEAERLTALEDAKAAEAGVPQHKSTLDAAEARLAEIDAEIAAGEDVLRDLVTERVAWSSGKDRLYKDCVELLSDALQQKSIGFLRERAARTPDREDDELVRRLEELDDEIDRIEGDLREFSRLHDTEYGRLNELEGLRRRFKSSRFDDVFSEFRDWALIALVLREFMRGAAGSRDVWKTIERQQRIRKVKASPDFGSLKFPKAPKRGPWRMPKGGGFRGGGFRSGGGFRGGGGFKTGGGF